MGEVLILILIKSDFVFCFGFEGVDEKRKIGRKILKGRLKNPDLDKKFGQYQKELRGC